jgi:hypothetical protein
MGKGNDIALELNDKRYAIYLGAPFYTDSEGNYYLANDASISLFFPVLTAIFLGAYSLDTTNQIDNFDGQIIYEDVGRFTKFNHSKLLGIYNSNYVEIYSLSNDDITTDTNGKQYVSVSKIFESLGKTLHVSVDNDRKTTLIYFT